VPKGEERKTPTHKLAGRREEGMREAIVHGSGLGDVFRIPEGIGIRHEPGVLLVDLLVFYDVVDRVEFVGGMEDQRSKAGARTEDESRLDVFIVGGVFDQVADLVHGLALVCVAFLLREGNNGCVRDGRDAGLNAEKVGGSLGAK
jgi:hypothetical protein